MSQETLEWLNRNVLVGFTKNRGTAWHYRASEQGAEPNHYDEAIPVKDVERRLFDSEAVKADVYVVIDGKTVEVPDKAAIVNSKTGDIYGIFGRDSYQIHQYREWLLQTVSTILSDTLNISSAGLLKKGAIAWVEISVPETVHTPEGVDFRPNLLATTSLNGEISTVFKRTITQTVCDNTRAVALGEKGEEIRIRHSRYSNLRIDEARRALSLVQETAQEFEEQIKMLCSIPVSDADYERFLKAYSPIPDDKGRKQTIAQNKVDALLRFWRTDERVTPWRNTAQGVLSAVNTWSQHESRVVGERAERNMLRTVSGDLEALDREVFGVLSTVLN